MLTQDTDGSLTDLPPGQPKWNVPSFNEVFGDEYGKLSQAEKDEYCALLKKKRDAKHPTMRKSGKEALTDINTTLQTIVNMVRDCPAI